MATLLEMAKDIVAAHAQTTALSTDELIQEIHQIYAVLQQLESGTGSAQGEPQAEAESAVSALTIKQAFKTNEVICMVCGKSMKSLTRHLSQAHQMKPSQYRKHFNIPKTQKLMSKAYAAKRIEIAAGMNLGANLEKARAARTGNVQKGKK